MAVGLHGLPSLGSGAAIRPGTVAAGIRKKDRRDLVLIECAPGTHVAAVFTKNRFCAAPVIVAREHLAKAAPRALLINTGFANAGSGEPGLEDARACCAALARQIGCRTEEILPFSTGVIGERFPRERIIAGLPACQAALNENGWAEAAHGIMTTDTVPKGCSRKFRLGSHTVTVTGIAKGAGMIRPDMATLLAFVATDAAMTPAVLQACVSAAVIESFNRMTVAGDTCTKESCGLVARDAEGATKFITIEVRGGRSDSDCPAVLSALASSRMANSPVFASDPNWG